MPAIGFEPIRSEEHLILSQACIPFHHAGERLSLQCYQIGERSKSLLEKLERVFLSQISTSFTICSRTGRILQNLS